MTNFEAYEEKIKSILAQNTSIAMVDGEIVECRGKSCIECKFSPMYEQDEEPERGCGTIMIRWLYEEYKPVKKLTKKERKFCEMLERGWFARDSNGTLYYYTNKPYKIDVYWNYNMILGSVNTSTILNPNTFPHFNFISWDDEEPYSIEELLTWEAEDE